MSQRLGIAAAILGKPKYLILDEPANGLDPEGIAWLRDFLKNYADEGNAVLVSSHLLSEMSLMADNIIVIGKGKLIIDTSMPELLSGSKASTVFVRANKLPDLEKALTKANINHVKKDDGISVTGTKTDDVGKIAFENKITVLELARHSASLEEVFLELTEGAEEYKGHSKEAKK
jgi:ABC-2 type transport system ATP-binding protein